MERVRHPTPPSPPALPPLRRRRVTKTQFTFALLYHFSSLVAPYAKCRYAGHFPTCLAKTPHENNQSLSKKAARKGGGGGEQRKRAQRHIHGAIESSVYFRILSTSVCSYQCITPPPKKKKQTDRFTAPTSDQPLYNFYVAQADTIQSPQDCCVSK